LKNGNWSQAIGKAEVADETGAKLRVWFATKFIKSNYWIVRLADDYSHAVVAAGLGNNFQYLWILSRTPKIDQKIYDSIIDSLRAEGYKTDRLIITDQSC
jgi:apolipoprotein D and lipocalin family protein